MKLSATVKEAVAGAQAQISEEEVAKGFWRSRTTCHATMSVLNNLRPMFANRTPQQIESDKESGVDRAVVSVRH